MLRILAIRCVLRILDLRRFLLVGASRLRVLGSDLLVEEQVRAGGAARRARSAAPGPAVGEGPGGDRLERAVRRAAAQRRTNSARAGAQWRPALGRSERQCEKWSVEKNSTCLQIW